MAKAVQAAIGRVDKDLALTRVQTLDEVVEDTMVQPRFRAVLATVFALGALALRRWECTVFWRSRWRNG
jgi:hypothetical protein